MHCPEPLLSQLSDNREWRYEQLLQWLLALKVLHLQLNNSINQRNCRASTANTRLAVNQQLLWLLLRRFLHNKASAFLDECLEASHTVIKRHFPVRPALEVIVLNLSAVNVQQPFSDVLRISETFQCDGNAANIHASFSMREILHTVTTRITSTAADLMTQCDDLANVLLHAHLPK